MIQNSPFDGKSPKIHPSAFIAEDAVIIGDVEIGPKVNIWYGAKIRAAGCKIVIGANTSVQENVVIHSEPGTTCEIGKDVIIGHLAMVHGPCQVGDSVLIGLSSTVLQNAVVEEGAVIAGGSVMRGTADKHCLYAGTPAVKKKNYGEDRMELGREAAAEYVENGQGFKKGGLGQKIPKEFLEKQ